MLLARLLVHAYIHCTYVRTCAEKSSDNYSCLAPSNFDDLKNDTTEDAFEVCTGNYLVLAARYLHTYLRKYAQDF